MRALDVCRASHEIATGMMAASGGLVALEGAAARAPVTLGHAHRPVFCALHAVVARCQWTADGYHGSSRADRLRVLAAPGHVKRSALQCTLSGRALWG
jgi:hypothetical protein